MFIPGARVCFNFLSEFFVPRAMWPTSQIIGGLLACSASALHSRSRKHSGSDDTRSTGSLFGRRKGSNGQRRKRNKRVICTTQVTKNEIHVPATPLRRGKWRESHSNTHWG